MIILIVIGINYIEGVSIEPSLAQNSLLENISRITFSSNAVFSNNLQSFSMRDKAEFENFFTDKVSDYIVYTDGSQFYAKNGFTGEITYHSTNAKTTIQNALDDLTNGGKIFYKKDCIQLIQPYLSHQILYLKGKAGTLS